ncbi:hypothetical protein QP020_02525 [Gallibacterium anatis]|uniref:hypothetical protein n=1 Tax=Gallibacterium anatis TaxID=750 RepID=UPI00255126E5|nr:hypothetical protein [Gallibacterium anatis]WIM84925.1 hypothetical protein QP020_02525 [Gallibacterium anatis]
MSKFHQNIFNILCEVNNVQKINIELILIYDKIKKPISISEQHQELYQESLALLQSYEIVKNDISEDEYLSYIRKKSYSCLIEKNPTVEEIRNYLN